MSTVSHPRRLVLAAVFATAMAAAPATVYFAGPSAGSPAPAVSACPAGEDNDVFTDNCVPTLVPNVPGGAFPTPGVTPPDNGQITESTPGDPDSVPEVDGVPCVGGRSSGSCIGLEEDAVPDVVPHSTLSSSP